MQLLSLSPLKVTEQTERLEVEMFKAPECDAVIMWATLMILMRELNCIIREVRRSV